MWGCQCVASPGLLQGPRGVNTLIREPASHSDGTARDPLRLMMVLHETPSNHSERGSATHRGGSRRGPVFTVHRADPGAWTGRPLDHDRGERQSVARRDQRRRNDDLRRSGPEQRRHLPEAHHGRDRRRGVSCLVRRTLVGGWHADRIQAVHRTRADRSMARRSDRDPGRSNRQVRPCTCRAAESPNHDASCLARRQRTRETAAPIQRFIKPGTFCTTMIRDGGVRRTIAKVLPSGETS